MQVMTLIYSSQNNCKKLDDVLKKKIIFLVINIERLISPQVYA